MIYLKAVFLAVVEGVTEFLPVSSTGHMILVNHFLELSPDEDFNFAFMVIIQLPAVLAVVFYFWKDLWPFVHDAQIRAKRLSLWVRIGIAFIPAAVAGVLFDDLMEAYLLHPAPVAIALGVGGILLILLELRKTEVKVASVHGIGAGRALGIGVFQCLAMFPGISRSAATIIGAMALGAGRSAATEFSFFLAIPTMLGATVYKMTDSGFAFTPTQWRVIALGSAVAFIVAYAVVALFMNYVRRHDFKPFGYYRIALAIVVLAAFFFLDLD